MSQYVFKLLSVAFIRFCVGIKTGNVVYNEGYAYRSGATHYSRVTYAIFQLVYSIVKGRSLISTAGRDSLGVFSWHKESVAIPNQL